MTGSKLLVAPPDQFLAVFGDEQEDLQFLYLAESYFVGAQEGLRVDEFDLFDMFLLNFVSLFFPCF